MNKEFNWFNVLDDVETYGVESKEVSNHFYGMCLPDEVDSTDSNAEVLESLAGDWVTCACGQLCKVLPRTSYGEPYDQKLATLGQMFHNAIEFKDWTSAKNVLNKIEVRTSYLLKQMESWNH